MRRAKEIEIMELKKGSMTRGEYAYKFEELEKYSTLVLWPKREDECIKFENRLKPKLRKAVGILEISDFPTLIHKYRLLEDFENNHNNTPRYFGP